jgi:hypothetical protein
MSQVSIEIPVSIGEALDKISILEIKLDKITDDRRNDVKKEYDLIYGKLEHFFTDDSKFHYKILKQINIDIWEDQDKLRYTSNEHEKIQLAMKITKDNDRRFRVKSKLNTLFDSSLKEQKGYVKRKAFFLGHLGMGDILTCVGIIRWLATEYEETHVVCFKRNAKNFKMIFQDDPSIFCYEIEKEDEISPNLGCSMEKFKEKTEGYTVYNLLQNKNYIFLHNTSSTGESFDKDILDNFVDTESYILINPNKNMYREGEDNYELAQQFINYPLVNYKELIENADTIFMTDSSFFCFMLNLRVKSKNIFYFPRDGTDYCYLLSKIEKTNKIKFHKIVV